MTAPFSAMADPYPHWLFDDSEIPDPLGHGQRAVNFVRAHRHPASVLAGQAFEMVRFQERFIRKVWGTRKPDGSRQYTDVRVMMPRGARKTSLGAICALLEFYSSEAPGKAEVLLAAYNREQARIAFDEAAGIVSMTPRVKRRLVVRDSKHEIRYPATHSKLKAISADAKTSYGLTPTFALIDELHVWNDPKLYNTISSGLRKRPNTLKLIISQAGRGQGNIAFEEFDYARRVASGEVDAPHILPVLLETPLDADWRSEEVWRRANPGIEYGWPDIESFRRAVIEAEHSPTVRDTFKNEHLNMWLNYSQSPLFDMSVYDKGQREIDFAELADLPCYIGVDLSRSGDLTAIVVAWRHGDGTITVRPIFYLPDENLQKRADRDQAPYVRWRDEGFLRTVPGFVIEPAQIEAEIRDIVADNDNVVEVAVDPNMADTLLHHLVEDGIPAFKYDQTRVLMAKAAADLERVVNGERIRHDGHPILRAHLDNVRAVTGSDDKTLMKKAKATDRIDGAIAAAIAVSRAEAANDNHSIYDDAEARPGGFLMF
ncbi:terminase large subunit [Devosia sp. SL43]|uniref:terminase large subunit n=1 Tax=Devosia sp. SL43 TaxID=2806348 RepID=UPI001F48A50C|nr:terminase TerL endonuclease subunit [Devosia sp. SL43]UJW85766.1 terminase large subunit [Devosia sp. SL43]